MAEFKLLWTDLKRTPALLITLIVVAGIIIYYFYKQNQSSSTSNTTNTQPTYELDTISVTPPPPPGPSGPPGLPGPIGPVGPTKPSLAIRAKATSGKFAGYDKNNSGVPFWGSPGTNSIGTVPYGAAVTSPSMSVVTGRNHGGSSSYEQISYGGKLGYVSTQDLATG